MLTFYGFRVSKEICVPDQAWVQNLGQNYLGNKIILHVYLSVNDTFILYNIADMLQ